MPKINQEEYEVLKELDDKWKWVARDGFTGIVNVYEDKPRKIGLVKEWTPMGDRANKTIFKGNLFQFIQWEGGEPYSIVELIEEYESEETEVKKDLEWLKEKIKEEHEYNRAEHNKGGFEGYAHRGFAFKYVLKLINQLDEPEVLSDKWIDDNSVYASSDGITEEYVHVDDLQNLLVPKQEELEVKIQELIETYKQEEDAYSNPENGWISGFVEDLKNLVEEEQRYYVLDKEDATLLKKSAAEEGVAKSVGTNIYNVKSWKDEEKYQLTEQEIKDYDERFWPFAVKVEELEE